MRLVLGVFLVSASIVLLGCASTKYDVQKTSAQKQPEKIWAFESIRSLAENPDYVISITPSGTHAYNGFNLTVRNKSSKNIEVNWNKTLYVANGVTSGGFMFEGVVYKDRNNPKQSDIVFPGVEFNKTIYPNSLVQFSFGNWRHPLMNEGEHGAVVTLTIDGKDVGERLGLRFFKKTKSESG